ncbi:hypothetical protein Cgig2_018444 [Carnegiea gigantea]|uniref:Aminotransferase-like plant mobile domain-containing protein n=1 Tax=Carnegiea gigantea TaxID=171969 RepID=A0A9Q1JM40_9CARY|nr:hypothetical protein Cgig2_018444 [Carnegiea gigantea]
MASGVGYCLPTAILASIYKGLNEISRSSHPSRGGEYFPAHFLYTWLAKNFDVYELVGENSSSPGMVMCSDIGQSKSIRSGFVSYRCEESFVMEHYYPDRSNGQDEIPIGLCEPTTEKVTELPPEGAENIMDIINSEPNPTECMVCHTPFDGLPSLKGDFDSLYATILQRGIDITPLETKVEGLIKQACDFKDLQQSYFGRTSAEERDTCRLEVQGMLDEASRRLNTDGAYYEVKTAELQHVESRHQKLLKELQLLEEQQKDLSSQGAASEHLLQEAEWEVIDLQGQIDILNAI